MVTRWTLVHGFGQAARKAPLRGRKRRFWRLGRWHIGPAKRATIWHKTCIQTLSRVNKHSKFPGPWPGEQPSGQHRILQSMERSLESNNFESEKSGRNHWGIRNRHLTSLFRFARVFRFQNKPSDIDQRKTSYLTHWNHWGIGV